MSCFDPEISWAAGLFEGEGTITQSGGRLVVRVKMTDEEVVYEFARVIRFGEVYGPYHYEARDGHKRKPFWMWVAEEYEALEVLELLWPLAERKAQGTSLGSRANGGHPPRGLQEHLEPSLQ